ncbi:MAG: hypothetical protein GX325_07430 [Peptococcaceae bacterium]|nr:hypothetical protein [Peptococcaceae bacterium]
MGKEVITEKSGDELMQNMIGDILVGLKAKMIQPVMNENAEIARCLAELRKNNQSQQDKMLKELEKIAEAVQNLPMVILTAVRDALDKAGGGNQDGF